MSQQAGAKEMGTPQRGHNRLSVTRSGDLPPVRARKAPSDALPTHLAAVGAAPPAPRLSFGPPRRGESAARVAGRLHRRTGPTGPATRPCRLRQECAAIPRTLAGAPGLGTHRRLRPSRAAHPPLLASATPGAAPDRRHLSGRRLGGASGVAPLRAAGAAALAGGA